MDFQVGDRVYVTGPNNTGKYGVIVNIDDNPFQPIVVCHDEPFTGGHDCEVRLRMDMDGIITQQNLN